MKSFMIAASAAVLSVAAIPAVSQAQEVYGTIGYAGVEADDANLGAIQGRLGYKFNPYVGIEGEAAFGVADDTVSGVDVELKHELGAYVVGFLPVTPKADLFARVGYTSSEFDTSLGSVDGDGAAWGVGGQYHFTDKDGVRVDWTRHDYDAGDANVWSVGYTRKF
ncbi:MAG: porin family protein [Caulobacterales bacterium]|nr:porin family protein [Caulobacterales bacterium]